LIGFNDLNTLFPDVARQADGWDPTTVIAGTAEFANWLCDSGHRWNAKISSRTYGARSGCPSCAKSGFDPNEDGYLYFITHPD